MTRVVIAVAGAWRAKRLGARTGVPITVIGAEPVSALEPGPAQPVSRRPGCRLAAGLLRRRLERQGIAALTDAKTAAVKPSAMLLMDRSRSPAGIVAAAVGIRPETTLVREASLRRLRLIKQRQPVGPAFAAAEWTA